MDPISARNERAVHAFFDAERRRDLDAWGRFWHEDGRQTFWFADGTPPVVGRAALIEATGEKFRTRPPYRNDVITEPLVDPTRVLARLHLSAGQLPELSLDIWCLFHFDEEGLLVEIEEIVDNQRR